MKRCGEPGVCLPEGAIIFHFTSSIFPINRHNNSSGKLPSASPRRRPPGLLPSLGMSTINIRPSLGWKVKYNIEQDGALRYQVECANSLGQQFTMQDVTCGSSCVLTAHQGAMSSKARICTGTGQHLTTGNTGFCYGKFTFDYGGRSYRWKQKTWSWSWTFKLIDETSDREIATLKAHPGLRGSSSIYLYEGQWDPAWVQIVVLTAVLAIKAVQLSRYASYGV